MVALGRSPFVLPLALFFGPVDDISNYWLLLSMTSLIFCSCQSLPKAHFTSMYDCVSGGVQCIYKLAYEIGSYNALNMLIRHFR